jgi:1L-myo-inositol 1-phosphate cytidylyltransferase
MREITDAVILMAGSGSRLRASGKLVPKPLVPVLKRPLISYVIDCLSQAGIRTLHVVVGCESGQLLGGLEPLIPAGMRFHPIENPQWKKQNGISLLSAEKHVAAPFFLMMADHLFEYSVLDLLLREGNRDRLNLAIDKKLASIFDLEDAMKVQTDGKRVVAIGKDLATYDAIDTGAFLCSPEIFAYLRAACREDDCSLADGVRLMAADNKVCGLDIGSAWWQDVDTEAMLARAEEQLLTRARRSESVALTSPADERLARER